MTTPNDSPPPQGRKVIQAYLKSLDSSPGVYRMLDAESRVLYVGKASQQAIGYRLSSYFKKVDGICSIAQGHSWSSPPTHVVTWAVPDLMFFEASALEEYVIHQLKDELPDNTVGKSA